MYLQPGNRSPAPSRFLPPNILTRTRAVERKREWNQSVESDLKYAGALERISDSITARQTRHIKAQIFAKQEKIADKYGTDVFYRLQQDQLVLLLFNFIELLSDDNSLDYEDTMKQWGQGNSPSRQKIVNLQSHHCPSDKINVSEAEAGLAYNSSLTPLRRSKKTNIEINFDFTQVIELIEEQSGEQNKKKDGMIQKLRNLLLGKEQEIQMMQTELEQKGEQLKQLQEALFELQRSKKEQVTKKDGQLLQLSNNYHQKEMEFKKELQLLEKAAAECSDGQEDEGECDDFLKRCLYTQAISLQHFLGFNNSGYVKEY